MLYIALSKIIYIICGLIYCFVYCTCFAINQTPIVIRKDIIIIGAGAGGLFAGLHCSKCDTLILEKMPSTGKKLLMSGSGRCNITHEGSIREFITKYGAKSKFVKPALLEYSNSDLLDLLRKNGIKTISNDNGKVFPESEKSQDILDLFLRLNSHAGTEIMLNQNVQSVEKIDNLFHVKTDKQVIASKYLLIAAGGSSYPQTGSDGTAYSLAKKLGHTIIPPTPALTAVIPENYIFSSLSGVSIKDAEISLFRDGKKINQHTGDFAFTHKSLSGPGIIDFSRYIKSGDTLAVNFTGLNEQRLREALIEDSRQEGAKALKNYLRQYPMPQSLLTKLLSISKIDADKKLSELNKQDRHKLIELMTSYKFTVAKKIGFNQAMATAGGVDTKEINPKTMESKITEKLFFAGEYIDIDGDTGGYNLQFAFSTAFLACKHIRKKMGKSD